MMRSPHTQQGPRASTPERSVPLPAAAERESRNSVPAAHAAEPAAGRPQRRHDFLVAVLGGVGGHKIRMIKHDFRFYASSLVFRSISGYSGDHGAMIRACSGQPPACSSYEKSTLITFTQNRFS